MTVKLVWSINDGQPWVTTRDCGLVPIMVRVSIMILASLRRPRLADPHQTASVPLCWQKAACLLTWLNFVEPITNALLQSVRCHLRDASSAELVQRHEEADEFGGYFIVNGNERIIRYLILPRRNHVISLVRPSFQNRGASYTEYAVQIRCARKGDQSSLTNTLHYLSNGSCMLRFSWRKSEYVVPIMLLMKAATGASDREIFESIIMRDYGNTYLTDRVELLLRSFKTYRLNTREQCLEYLGDKFRVVLGLRDDWTNIQVGEWLLNKVLLVHLEGADSLRQKFRMLAYMLRKLYALVSGSCAIDNPDSPQHQEVLLPGALYGMIVKERLEEALNTIRGLISVDVRNNGSVDFHDSKWLNKVIAKANFDVGARLSNFLATGNLVSPSGLDLQQASGFTIVAEKLNWHRYISHFRCIHRGAFFAELKTTTVRKLLPDSWGFLCPVHTPDGSPCGLLNHLTRSCRIIVSPLSVAHIPALLYSRGLTQPISSTAVDGRSSLCVQLDGQIIGWARPTLAKQLADDLRVWKTEGQHNVPLDLEIGWVPPNEGGQYPGLFLFSSRARMMRPVKFLANERLDSIGSFEQVYMDIAVKAADVTEEEVKSGEWSHVELSTSNFMSILANMTPFSDFNQARFTLALTTSSKY